MSAKKIKDKDVGKGMMGNLEEIYKQIDILTLEKLLDKDDNFKNRYLIDMIDNIFVEEMDTQKHKMEKLSRKISQWAKNNELPSNVYATYLKQQLDEEKQKAKQENLKEETALNDEDT